MKIFDQFSKKKKAIINTDISAGTYDDSIIIKNTLDEMEKKYNLISKKEFLKGYEYFWECYKYVLQLESQGYINILKADCTLAHLSDIMKNDGPEYAAVIQFCLLNHNEQKYEIGVCVRGAPMFQKCL